MRCYHLIDDGDRVLIALSGGKDSLCLTEFLTRRSRIRMPRFEVEAIHVRMNNIDYENDTHWIEQFCNKQDVKLHIIDAGFKPDGQKRRTPCFLCSWTRRKHIFNFAQKNGFRKIALGHHNDDLMHTLLMNEMFAGQFATMPVKLRFRKMPLTLIRPLCLVSERIIRDYAEKAGYRKQLKQCPYEHESKRSKVRLIFEAMERENPEIRFSLWHALERDGKLIEG